MFSQTIYWYFHPCFFLPAFVCYEGRMLSILSSTILTGTNTHLQQLIIIGNQSCVVDIFIILILKYCCWLRLLLLLRNQIIVIKKIICYLYAESITEIFPDLRLA